MWEVKETEEGPDFIRAATVDYFAAVFYELPLRNFSVLVTRIREESVGAITGAEALTVRLLEALADGFIFGGHLSDVCRVGCGRLHAGVVTLHRIAAIDAVAIGQCIAVEVFRPPHLTFTEFALAIFAHLLAKLPAGQAEVVTLESLNHHGAAVVGRLELVRGRVAVREIEEAEEGADFIGAAVLDHVSTRPNEVGKLELGLFSALAPRVRKSRMGTIGAAEAVAVGLTERFAGVLRFSEHGQLPGAPCWIAVESFCENTRNDYCCSYKTGWSHCKQKAPFSSFSSNCNFRVLGLIALFLLLYRRRWHSAIDCDYIKNTYEVARENARAPRGLSGSGQTLPVVNVHYHGNHFSLALKGGHIQGSLLYQCTLNQLKVSLGEGLKSSASPRTLNTPHPN